MNHSRPIIYSSSLSPADYVDLRIGTARFGRGGTVIGPTVPHGSIHPSPDTADGGHAGYHPAQPIRGFSQLHASGTGWGRYGHLLLSPQIGIDVTPEGHDSPHSEERALAHLYRVRLDRYDLLAELTPARHSAFYRFTYPARADAHLLLDLAHQIPGQISKPIKVADLGVTESTLALSPDGRAVSGSSRYDGGWGAGPYTVYFHAELDRAPVACGTFKNTSVTPSLLIERWSAPGDRVGGWWQIDARENPVLLLKIGVSFHSIEKARAHLRDEIPGWDFDATAASARAAWNETLGRVEISGSTPNARTQIYTALYHAQIMPRDRTGEFARFAPDVPMWDDHYAIWDTWRTKYPLMLLLQPHLVRGTIASFVERLRVDGRVRDSFTAGTNGPGGIADQGGNDLDNLLADAFVKGLSGVDWPAAYSLLTFNAEHERRGTSGAHEAGPGEPLHDVPSYRTQGWIPAGIMSVSNTLEYSYNDFCAAQVARGLGHSGEADKYFERSRQWRHLFNPDTESDGFKGFLMPRRQDGGWVECDPKNNPGSWKDFYYEAPAWNYSFFVPHEAARLIELMGGPELFARRLDFGLTPDRKDSRGLPLIDFGNEPAFLAPMLFIHAGRPDLTAKHVDTLIRTRYTEPGYPGGYPGDDDSGAMASYYVFATLGFFPNAGQDLYYLTGPRLDRIVIDRPEEGRLEITRSGEGCYIAGVTLNGRPLDRAWIRHTEIKNDTILVFTMSETPTAWGTQTPPPSDLGKAL